MTLGFPINGNAQVAEGLAPSHPSHFQYCSVSVDDVPQEDIVAHFPRLFAFIDAATNTGTTRHKSSGSKPEGSSGGDDNRQGGVLVQ
jgi:hypothetical protein